MTDGVVLPHDWFPRSVPANVALGERSWLYSSFAFLHYRSQRPWGVRVGHDSGIYAGTMFDLGPEGQVEIGNYCSVVGAVISSNGRVVIGDYALIAHEVFMADSPFAVPPTATGGRRDGTASAAVQPSIAIGRNAWIGARAVLLAPASIGEGAIVGAAAVIDFEVSPYAIVAGNPARVVGWAPPGSPEEVGARDETEDPRYRLV